MILFDFAVVYWFCCYDELRWEAPDREKGEDLGRMPRYAASRATDAIARASENGEDLGRMPRYACNYYWLCRREFVPQYVILDDDCAFVLLLICVMFTN